MSFPVFLRTDNEHLGPLTGLIHTKPELERAISFAILTGREAGRLLVVEFCDVSDATGRFRKYAAFRVGTRIIPRHLLVGCDWMQKANCGAAADEQTVAEEMEYLRANPHAAELMAIFEAAHIDYGRIDYGLKDGRINVWEINTNPTVIAMTTPYHPLRDEANRYFSERITPAFHAIDSDPPGKRIDLRDGRRRFEVEARRRMRRWRRALRDFGFRPDLAHPRVWRPLLSGLLS
jgi:hypothetical protein